MDAVNLFTFLKLNDVYKIIVDNSVSREISNLNLKKVKLLLTIHLFISRIF